MAVAHKQIDELLHVFEMFMDPETVTGVLNELSGTTIYRTNKSFRDTIDRLIAHDRRCNQVGEPVSHRKEDER